LIHIKGNRYAPAYHLDLMSGTLQCISKGSGYVTPEDPSEQDVFISRDNMNIALHLDKVMVKIIKRVKGKNPEGIIVEVRERQIKNIVGVYQKKKNYGFVKSDDPKILTDIFIPQNQDIGAQDGQKVLARIDTWDSPRTNPVGRIVEILGFPDDPGIDELIVLREFDLNEHFPKEAEIISSEFTEEDIAQEALKRKDLREITCFTVDPYDAKDFDDAVSISMTSKGYQLGVHIADVSHYVQEDSALDKEAYRRGTSVYLVNKVIPMLPVTLSNHLCSLMPDKDRLAMSIFIDIDLEGNVLGKKIFPSVIRSKKRFAYEDVQEIFNKMKENQDISEIEFSSDLELMYKLFQVLREKRIEEGSLELDLPEVKITIKDSEIDQIFIKERLESHQMIEEFMLMANQQVARYLEEKNLPALYRVHDMPDAAKIELLANVLGPIGILFNVKKYSNPKSLQDVIRQVETSSYGYLVNRILLRTLKKACYQPDNIGHYALNFSHYTHFTSPIRRYPDLIVHRVLKTAKKKRKKPVYYEEQHEALIKIGDYCSQMERRAEEAERLSIRLKQITYIKKHLGDIFEGIISGVTSFGLFVELPDNLIEGMIRMSELDDDYYFYDEKQMRLIGKKTNKIFRMGDAIRIQVSNVSSEKKQIDFVLAPEETE